jgi:hypothetical protein
MIAVATFWIVNNSPRVAQPPSRVWWLARATFGAAVAFIMAFPTTVSPHLDFVIRNRQTQQRIRHDITAVLETNPAFSGLTVSTERRKSIIVTISGSLPSIRHLNQLHSQLSADPEAREGYWLTWEIDLLDTGEHIDSSDRALFPAADEAA